MIHRVSKDKTKLNLLKEVGYILLLIIFFVGVIIGSFGFKNVDTSSLSSYYEDLNDTITKVSKEEFNTYSKTSLYLGIKTIVIFWIVGLSLVGTPILVAYVGYKGYSIGYTVSTIVKIWGTSHGNSFVFKYLFFKNVVLVFIMIFLANFSIKISKNFLEKKTDLKPEMLQYSAVTGFMLLLWLLTIFIERIFFTTF